MGKNQLIPMLLILFLFVRTMDTCFSPLGTEIDLNQKTALCTHFLSILKKEICGFWVIEIAIFNCFLKKDRFDIMSDLN